MSEHKLPPESKLDEMLYKAKLREVADLPIDDVYDLLHDATLRHLTAKLLAGKATAPEVSQARQLLKDNGVTSISPSNATPLRNLADAMPFDAEAG